MPLYKYRAYDGTGAEVEGIVDAEDLAAARQIIKGRGLAPFEVDVSVDSDQSFWVSKGLSLAEQTRFTRQLAALLKGGVTLTKALTGIESQEAWQHKKSLLICLREGIEKGGDFSAVLADNGGVFPPALLSIIRIGETTGRLDFAFARISSHLETEMEHRRRLIAAIAYPAVTAVISVGVMAFLMVYLVPTVATMFADVQGQLPWITQLIIAFSNAFSAHWQWFSLLVVVLMIAFRLALKLPAFRRLVERLERKIPIWGSFIEGMRMESWARSTSIMLQCGVTLLESVRVMRENESSISQAEALAAAEKNLERGLAFSEALKLSGRFPVFLVQMIEAGEASGELAPMLESAANELESENRVITELFLNILEPILIVVMGSVVGTIMIGVLLPIYEMNRLL